jgi:hypothetical protein
MFSDESSRWDTFRALQGYIERSSKRLIYWLLGILVIYVIARGVAGAAARPFWFDELCTLAIAGQPTLREMWHAVARGFDSAPPGFYLVERAALGLVSNKQIALRLPSILAFPCILICVFEYVKKRSGEAIAFLCALLLLSTSLFHTYLIEARAYSMVLACIAFALVCYQRLPSVRGAAMLGVSLSLAESLHYYAVFGMIPFWVAEGVVFLRTRRFRWPVWVALGAGTLPLAAFWPLLSSYRAYYGNYLVYSHPALSGLPDFYGSYFLIDGAFGAALALVSIAAITWSRFWPQQDISQQWKPDDGDVAEVALLLSLIALPLIAFVLVRPVHGLLLNRYVLATTIGVVLGVACALSIARPRMVALFALFVLSSVGVRELRFWHHSGVDPMGRAWSVISADEFVQIEKFVQDGGHLDLPVVFGPGLVYAQTAYYSPPSWTRRLVYLMDDQRELSREGNDIVVRALSGLRDFMPLRLADYSTFTAAHREFLLYSEGEDWTFLNREAASMQLLEMEGARRLYLVKMKETSPH